MARIGLLDALDFCVLLAAEAPDRYDSAARRWLGLLLAECGSLTLDGVQLAVACLRSLPAGDVDPVRETLRALVKRGIARAGSSAAVQRSFLAKGKVTLVG